MQIHEINKPEWQKEKRSIGRGGKRGTYSGKGNKGQKARSGGSIAPGFEGRDTTMVSRAPKISGFSSPKLRNIVLDFSTIEKNFNEGEEVSYKSLIEKKIVRLNKRSRTKRKARVKILGNGKLTKKLTFSGLLMSKSAKEIVEKTGGSVIEMQKTEKKRRRKESEK